jgi:thiol-disulfide isomerase/thioredoxin
VKIPLSYTRLSSNFQPKTASSSRRQVLKGVFGLSVAAIWPDFVDAATPPIRQPAPSMSSVILDKDNKQLTVASFRGIPVLINFWATWCPPCVAELPALNQAAGKLSGEVKILLVSVDRGGRKKALPFLQSRGISHPHLAFDAKGALSREMGVRGLPTSFLLSADQRYSWIYLGSREWDDAVMIAELHRILDG